MNNLNRLTKENMSGRNYEGPRPNTPVHFLTASSIIGDQVENSKGEHLGAIKDIMLDVRDGKIEYVVLEFGGFMGYGEKLFAIPFDALKLNPKKKTFIIEWDKSLLKEAPGFDKKHWPETNKHYEDVNVYWGSFLGANTGSDRG